MDDFEETIIRAVWPKIVSAAEKASADIVFDVQDAIQLGCPPHSEPGEPPRVETGELLSSIRYGIEEDFPTAVLCWVGAGPTTNAPDNPGFDYAPFLETDMNRPYLLHRMPEYVEAFERHFGASLSE